MKAGILAVTPAFFRVWRRNSQVYVALLKFNILPSLAEPVLFITVFGLGIGSYITEIEGVPYIEFVAAGILGSAAIMQATFECTYGSFFRMSIQGTFESIISTPVSASEVGLGEISWGASRGFVNSSLVLIILFFLGILDRWQVMFIPLLMFVAAFNFAAIAVLVTSRIAQMEYFRFYFAGFILPAQFLCGTFFPVSRFPEAVQVIAWTIPFTSVIDIARTLMLGRPADFALFLEGAWVFISTLIFTELAVRSMHKRLVR
ncbi:MAG: ABC transporter permease [Thermoleophilia bacterium]|nr:ABC transporter permease [Thermoleophilia bacterium]